MAKKRRIPKTTIFIACEGSNTEPTYFKNFKEKLEEDENYPYSITIYPEKNCENCKSDAIGLINEAIANKDNFDELWVIFDKDGYTLHDKAFNLANDNGVNIAFSSISFETWILLHFERCNFAFAKSANIIEDKFQKNECYLTSYDKSEDCNIFPQIKEKISDAFFNASWLRYYMRENFPNTDIFKYNPYTDVDLLVKKLILNENIYEFRLFNQKLNFKDFEITLKQTNNVYEAEITNLARRTLLLKEFQFYDINKKKINLDSGSINESDENILEGRSIKIGLIITAQNLPIFMHYEKLILKISSN